MENEKMICAGYDTCTDRKKGTFVHCQAGHTRTLGCETICNGNFCIPYVPEKKERRKGILIKIQRLVPESGVKSIKILSISGVLPKEKLPKEYLDGNSFWLEDNKVYFTGYNWFTEGDIFSFDDFLVFKKEMEACGQRLYEINARIREERATWKGEEEVII